jgi:hypothetical protein
MNKIKVPEFVPLNNGIPTVDVSVKQLKTLVALPEGNGHNKGQCTAETDNYFATTPNCGSAV